LYGDYFESFGVALAQAGFFTGNVATTPELLM